MNIQTEHCSNKTNIQKLSLTIEVLATLVQEKQLQTSTKNCVH